MKQIKRTLAILLTLLMLVSAVPFATFAAELTDEQKACTHQWTTKDRTSAFLKSAANCQSPAVYYYKCTKCKANAKDVAENQTYQYGEKNPDNHPEESIVPIDPDVKPVCQEAGKTAGKKCNACNAVIEPQQDLSMQPHTAKPGAEATCVSQAICKWCNKPFGEFNPNNHPADKLVPIQDEVPATCTQNGLSAGKRCVACTVTVEAVKVTTKDHEVGTAATCVSKAICKDCGQPFGEVDPNNHNLERQSAKASTCAVKGYEEYWKCAACNKLFSDAQGKTEIQQPKEVALDPANHSNLQRIEKKNATCEEEGMAAHWFCDGCSKYYSDSAARTEVTAEALKIDALGHTWSEWVYPADYNCDNGGTITRTCARCNKTESNTASGHKLVTDEAQAATCTENGKTEGSHCEICGTIVIAQEVEPALGHNFAGKATGNGSGQHTIQCTRCEESSAPMDCSDETFDCKCDVCGDQLAHTYTNYVPNGDATCAQDGTKTAYCDVCGNENTITDEGSSANAPHSYEWTNLNNATCLLNEQREGRCSLCGSTILEEIPNTAIGHIDSDWLYPEGFDCEAGGIRYKVCTVCGEDRGQESVEPRAHAEVIDPDVPRTCTENGKTAGLHCDICKKVLLAQDILYAEGHRPDENGFVRTKNPTCDEKGIESAKCVNCGQNFTQEISALGHNFVDRVVKPTCTGSGYTLHTCSRCGKTIKDNIVKATGHKMVQVVTPATTSKNGKIVMTCSVCGEKQTDVIYKVKTLKLSTTTYERNSKVHTPSVKITDSNGKKLKKDVDYKVKYGKGRKACGTYNVKVTFKGNYKGSKTLKFKVVPPVVKGLKVTKGTKKATLTWSRNKYADVYVVYRATEKNGTYKKLGSTDDLTFTAKKLKSGKVYYFKVAAVRKLDSGNYYSADSTIKKATIK